MDKLIGFVTYSFAIVNRIGQSFHILRHARADGGTTGKEKISNDDFPFQAIPGHVFAVLVGESDIGNRMPDRITDPFTFLGIADNRIRQVMPGHMDIRFALGLYDKVGNQGNHQRNQHGYQGFLVHMYAIKKVKPLNRFQVRRTDGLMVKISISF